MTPYTKDDHRAAKAAADAAWSAYNSTAEAERWKAASTHLDEIRDQFDDICTCEACGEVIFGDDLRSYDINEGMVFCAECSPTWEDFRREPTSFYQTDERGEPVYYTEETAKVKIAAHLAKGGKMTDYFVSMLSGN